ncbi:fungal-specific transcription factor domain-containing protein [Diplogelasinospora grovesii]|uniref:Fungal-specific transcription factor domain-containing protein n=1 Tax=Diplogelasinospora grovesii TaxID=303347 RepID=A0AAN6S825_9PEZI|nr:fungal-specific transcription factor domain-containing protein [Diplogelasinospora grovesii]
MWGLPLLRGCGLRFAGFFLSISSWIAILSEQLPPGLPSRSGPPSPDNPNPHHNLLLHHPSHKRARPQSPAPLADKESPTSGSGSGGGTGGGGGVTSPKTSDQDHHPHDDGGGGGGHGGASGVGGGKAGQSANFRNVSACNRCRLRKNRCDQKLPSCASCEKASVACVGYDPITKREIPRSYVFYLEKRVEQLEALLTSKNVAFPPAEDLEYCSKRESVDGLPGTTVRSPTTEHAEATSSEAAPAATTAVGVRQQQQKNDSPDTSNKRQRLSNVANPRHLGSATGVSFARVLFAAVQSSVSDQKSTSDKGEGSVRPYRGSAASSGESGEEGGTSMRDSFFGLHTKPSSSPAPFPDKALGLKLVTLYFEHANPQIPVLHRGDFMDMFEQAYLPENDGRVRGPRELYMLNMVFAIGGGIILGESAKTGGTNTQDAEGKTAAASGSSKQCQPEEYHASAVRYLDACLSRDVHLEELQAVLLLANFALLRPVPPGLWYIVGVSVRLAVDLGLHYEDGKDVDSGLRKDASDTHARERGRREYVRDMRRRLWWCTYSFDRLVSICVGRPFGISDQVITTEFPSLLEDRYITQGRGILEPPPDVPEPTYKLVAHHYFRLRLLQSEILQVLQFQQAQIARAMGVQNPPILSLLPSPFLSRFDSFRSWRVDIDRRLFEWKMSAPTKDETGVAFSIEFLDLNYWQAIIMLYRQSLSVPAMFEGEYNTSKEVNSPMEANYSMESREDEDRVYLKVAEAGQRIIRLYRQLHLAGLVNYTYLSTHHLFMAGISYLYAIWHSPIVRSRLSMDEVDFTVLAAKSVFTDLIDKCPPAEACRDAFDRTARATVKMANSTGGFGQTLERSGGPGLKRRPNPGSDYWGSRTSESSSTASGRPPQRRHQQRAGSGMMQSFGTPDSSSYANSTTSSNQLQMQFGLPSGGTGGVENEMEVDSTGFSLMRNLPPQSRSNTSSEDVVPTTSPVMTQGNAALFSPAGGATAGVGAINFGDLQVGDKDFNMDGIEGLAESTGSIISDSLSNSLGDVNNLQQLDLGLGLGWEGFHHDFSDGQQVDLFDGFFFGSGNGQ